MGRGVNYHHPTIGPRAYMARGSSGWSETFKRIDADDELKKLLGVIPLKTAFDGLRSQRKLTKQALDWSVIVGYLSFLCRCDEKMIEDAAGIAFWCQYIITEREGSTN